jgi:hypothetical protein
MAADYHVIPPNELHYGKSYSDLVQDWFNWFLTADPDKRNSARVIFLRSVEIPASSSQQNDLSSSTYADDQYFPRQYKNPPNVKIGPDKLQIYEDQAVFVPIILAYAEASKPYHDWGMMTDYTGLTIDYGDNPPEVSQLTINGNYIDLGKDMEEFRISTPVFTAIVPDTDYGRSAKDFLEMSLAPGHYPMIAEGYFVLIKFDTPGKVYTIHSFASAPREVRGPYFSELLYQIQVNKREGRGGPARGAWVRPASNQGIIRELISNKVRTGAMDAFDAEGVANSADITFPRDAFILPKKKKNDGENDPDPNSHKMS